MRVLQLRQHRLDHGPHDPQPGPDRLIPPGLGLLRAQEKALRGGGIETIMRVDMEFHHQLRELAGNRRLDALLRNLQDQVRIVFATSITIPGRREKAVGEHREILAAVEKRDPEAAERAARQHIRNVRKAVLATFGAGRSSDADPPAGRADRAGGAGRRRNSGD